jgi:hypothetical protein
MRAHNKRIEMLDVFSMCASRTIRRSYKQQSRNPTCNRHSPNYARHLHPCGNRLVSRGMQSVQQSPFRLPDSWLAYCHFLNRLHIVHLNDNARHVSLSWASSIQTISPTSHFLKIHRDIILPSAHGSSKWPIFLRFPPQTAVHDSPIPHTRYMPRPSHYLNNLFLLYHPRNVSNKWLYGLPSDDERLLVRNM